MEQNVFTGKTVEDAILEGLKELGLTREQVEIEVLEEPSKGFLGIGAKSAKVSIVKKLTDGEKASKFLEGLFEKMNITATTEINEDENGTVINVITTESSAVIGYRGEVLDSLQCLAGTVANIGKEEYSRIVVDCEDYRKKREETLKNLADKLAAKAVRTGRKVSLEPMNPYERRVIHFALAENTEVKTLSEGKEPNRYISIIPNNMKNGKPIKEGHGRNNDKNRRNGNRNYNGGRKQSVSGFTSVGSKPAKKSGFGGTYLGNSLKDNNN